MVSPFPALSFSICKIVPNFDLRGAPFLNTMFMNRNNQIIIYQTEDGQTQVDVRLENETVWLTTSQMAMLFDREESNIRRHVINVFKEGELEKEKNVHFLHVNGVKKPVPFYNLDVIISVGYRVKSQRGVQFRRWASKILKEYLVKGYAVNDRLRRDQLGELRQLVQVVDTTTVSYIVPTAPSVWPITPSLPLR